MWLGRDGLEPAEGTFTSTIVARLQLLAEDKVKAKAAGASLWS